MALKLVVIVAVALVVKLASSDFTPTGVKFDFGDLSELVNGLENGTYPYPHNVTYPCFRKNRENFKCLARALADLTTVVGGRFEKFFNDSDINEAMKKYSESFRELPKTLWTPLENSDYAEGVQAIEEAGQTEFDARALVFKKFMKNTTATQKAITQFEKIAEAKKNKTEKLTVTLKVCIEIENSKLHPKEMDTR